MNLLGGRVQLLPGDCREVMATLPDASVDAIVCDPPYALVNGDAKYNLPRTGSGTPRERRKGPNRGFMGKAWDTGEVAFSAEFWADALRVLKPGGHLVAFSGTRTYHRMACAIEDAGFEIRDQLAWVYGSGFPKSLDVSKAIDKAAGAEREVVGDSPFAARKPNGSAGVNSVGLSATAGCIITAPATDAARQWQGWGTALKPSWEPICLARRPLIGTVAANVLAHGTGALNIDGTRIATDEVIAAHHGTGGGAGHTTGAWRDNYKSGDDGKFTQSLGRFPANLLHDGSEEVVALFPETGGPKDARVGIKGGENALFMSRGNGANATRVGSWPADEGGSAARFFYTSKADAEDRLGSTHPTVKPVDLMQWLVRLVCPKGGVVLDPFAGTGTTGEAAWREGMRAILIEREPEYQADIARRMDLATQPTKRAAVAATKNKLDDPNTLPLFAGAAE
jgi:DNA modification methylase